MKDFDNDIYFEIDKPQAASLAGAVTSDVYSTPEVNGEFGIQVGNDAYTAISWGEDNQLPYKLKEAVERNSVMSQNKLFNVLTCYGRGIEYMDLASIGDEKHRPCTDKEVRDFFVRNNMKRFFAEQVTDLKFYFFCVCVIILNRDRTKILRIVHKDACHVRFEKADEHGVIRHTFYADWKDNDSPGNIEVIPLLDLTDPLGDLLTRVGREKDVTGRFALSPRSQTKFAVVCRMPTVGCQYYPIPTWTASLRDGWYDIYGLLTAAKRAKIKNGQNIRYHIEISTQFWENRARSMNISSNTQEFEQMKMDFIKGIKDYLGGSTNSDKLFWSEFESLMDGKQRHDVIINTVDTSKAGNEYNDDVAEASNVLCYDDNVHPNLAGATPGKSQMNNSGSDKRELFTMKQALETMPHDMMMVVHNTVLVFNGYDKLAFPEVPMILLTTLDKKTDAVEVPNNNE